MRLAMERLRASESHQGPGPACLDELALAAAVDGVSTPAVIEHLSRCAACRARMADLVRLLGDPAVAREADRLDGRRSGWPGWRFVAAAAAVILLVSLPLFRFDGGDDRFRDDQVAGTAAAPALLEPLDSIPRPGQFRWSGVAAASQYRVTLFDEEGALVWSAETADTAIALPDDVHLTAGIPYWWRVEARVDFDRWTASPLGVFIPEARR